MADLEIRQRTQGGGGGNKCQAEEERKDKRNLSKVREQERHDEFRKLETFSKKKNNAKQSEVIDRKKKLLFFFYFPASNIRRDVDSGIR